MMSYHANPNLMDVIVFQHLIRLHSNQCKQAVATNNTWYTEEGLHNASCHSILKLI